MEQAIEQEVYLEDSVPLMDSVTFIPVNQECILDQAENGQVAVSANVEPSSGLTDDSDRAASIDNNIKQILIAEIFSKCRQDLQIDSADISPNDPTLQAGKNKNPSRTITTHERNRHRAAKKLAALLGLRHRTAHMPSAFTSQASLNDSKNS